MIFCIQGNIKFFHNLIPLILTGVASMHKIPQITSLQYLKNDILDYLDFRYVHRPPNDESVPLGKFRSKIIANDNFYLKKEGRDQGSIIIFSYSEFL